MKIFSRSILVIYEWYLILFCSDLCGYCDFLCAFSPSPMMIILLQICFVIYSDFLG